MSFLTPSHVIVIEHQPVSSSTSSLYKSLNQTFTSSSFSRHSSSLFTLPHSSPSASRAASPAPRQDQNLSSGRNTPKKTVEKYPIFFLQLKFEDPTSQVDSSFGMGEFDKKYLEFKVSTSPSGRAVMCLSFLSTRL